MLRSQGANPEPRVAGVTIENQTVSEHTGPLCRPLLEALTSLSKTGELAGVKDSRWSKR